MKKNIIITTYFTTKKDPQRKRKVEPNNFNYIKSWYNSIKKLGLNGIIIHDDLSDEFVEKYTSPKIKFNYYPNKSRRSTNDERFVAYYKFLKERKDIANIFLTDLHDITFLKNPFQLIDDKKYDLYAGDDKGIKIMNSSFMKKRMTRAYGKVLYKKETKLIAGIIGGSYKNIMKLLDQIILDLQDLQKKKIFSNLNMGIFNKCAYQLFGPERIMYGEPLNSKFKRRQKTGNFCIRHK